MFVCVSSEINGSSFSEVLVILLYGWNFEKYEIHIFKEHTAVCHLSMFETRKLEKYYLRVGGCFGLCKEFQQAEAGVRHEKGLEMWLLWLDLL